MVATNAFGMGIDKSNVSFVIHYNMPQSLEAYYQEAGRAGRDGTEADCILLYKTTDVRTARFLIDNAAENDELDEAQRQRIRQQDLKRLDAMVGYCKTDTCLRGYILEYFGQNHPEVCGNCGSCTGEFEKVDITLHAQMLLSCVKRVNDKLGYGVGLTLISQTLRGSRDKRVLELGLDTLSTYGLLKNKGVTYVQTVAAQLESDGYLLTETAHQTLRLMPKAAQVLYQGSKVHMLVRKEQEVVAEKILTTVKLNAEEENLYEALRQLRARLAEEANVPAYVVFSNATLQDMARKKPRNSTEFKRVSGVGELKCKWYGNAFLAEIRKFL
jgi:ATP-dependent DNA helicase RecQ